METATLIFELLKFVLPSIVVFFAAYYIIKNQSDENIARLRLELKNQSANAINPVKLQAYERMVMFLERISPQQLILSHIQPDISAFILKHSMTNAVQQEFNHNLSQQIYISHQSWDVIKVVKEQVINLINQCAENIEPNASGAELSRAIIDKLIEVQEQPTDKAIQILKAEVGIYFG